MVKYYAVKNGRRNGIFTTWEECKSQVQGFSGAQYKSFPTREAAEAYRRGRSTVSPLRYKPGLSRKAGSSHTVHKNRVPELERRSRMGPELANLSPPEEEPYVPTGAQVIYTDGSSLGNGKSHAKAGWAAYWGTNDPRNSAGRVISGEQTNNRGELMAICETVKTIRSEFSQGTNTKTYIIMADSKYARDALTIWPLAWSKKDWKTSAGKPVLNRDLIEPTYREIKQLGEDGVIVEVHYVPGHAGYEGNEIVDRMARGAAMEKMDTSS